MAKLRIAILVGGKSGEHEVSLVSGLSVYRALDKSKYDVTIVGIDKTGRWVLPDQQKITQTKDARAFDLTKETRTVAFLPFQTKQQIMIVGQANEGIAFDLVIPILHGTNGEDGTVQGLFELANIPYVASGVVGSSVCMDKDLAKRVLRDAGVPVVPFITVRRHEFEKARDKFIRQAEAKFGYPYFVKPANMGSSVGVSKVKSAGDALGKFENAFLYDTKVLVEQGIDARELEISVLGNYDPKASIVGEIIPNHEFYSYEAKYLDADGADLKIPADNLSREVTSRIQELAVKAFQALECTGMARVDFFLDRRTGDLFVNELNTIPGFTSISMYPKLWEASGIKYADLLDQLIALGLERHREKNALKTTYEPS